jgi:hypothetical protein
MLGSDPESVRYYIRPSDNTQWAYFQAPVVDSAGQQVTAGNSQFIVNCENGGGGFVWSGGGRVEPPDVAKFTFYCNGLGAPQDVVQGLGLSCRPNEP